MKLIQIKLGSLIEQNTLRNSELKYGLESVKGMTITKEIIPTKANVKSKELPKFWVVKPNEFIYNPRTHGKKIGLGFNDTTESFLISWNNTAFHVREDKNDVLVPTYLFMFFNRAEWDRRACFDSWGSSTEVFSWEALCDMDIALPDISIQRKYVAIYKGLQDNLAVYQSKLDDLKLTCDAYIERLRHTIEPVRIGDYIEEVDERNTDLRLDLKAVKGISINKKFIETKANMTNVSLKPYKKVVPLEFVYVPVTSRNGGKISLAMNDSSFTYLVSSSYTVFKIKKQSVLNSHYLMLFLNRSEFDRYARFNSWGSARETFGFEDMCNVKIPIPKLEIQESIVKIFKVYNERKKIAEKLKQQLSDICPILIKGALEEGGAYGKEE